MKKQLSYFLLFILFMMVIMSTVSNAGSNFTLIYVVQDGDTLSEIARDYGLSADRLREVNQLSGSGLIKLGQELVIPFSYFQQVQRDWDLTFHQQEAASRTFFLHADNNYAIRVNPQHILPDVSNISRDKIIKYHVGRGDTLYDLARSFNTSIGVIMALNGMENSIIRLGDLLKLPIDKLTPRQALAKTIRQEDLELLARVIHGEARGEPFIGQVAVGAVVINRVISPYFPDTFRGVIYQRRQFSAVADGQINLKPNRTAYRAAREALKGTDPTMGAMYYYNPKFAKYQWWFQKRRFLVTIGDHIFTK
ncbi:MAG: cell wall hydrolase [Halanaerobiales bacterium]|nr:cell wall hydrolase [Halanaerobiales bacterium]